MEKSSVSLKKISRRVLPVLQVLLGNAVYAIAVHFFLDPSGIITGGATGIALFLHAHYGISLSLFLLIFNGAMLVLGFFTLGKQFALTTALSSFAYPIFIEILERLFPNPAVTQDLLLNAVFGGLGIGFGLGIVFRAGSSTGGMDVPPLILHRYLRVPAGIGMWGFDIVIILLQAFFSDREKLLYGIVMLFIYTVVIDKTTTLGTAKTQVKVISNKSHEIAEAILKDADRGVTYLKGRSGYLEKDTELVLTVVETRELAHIERLIHAIDPDSFMIVSRVTEVAGRGFTIDKEHLGRTQRE